MVYWIQVTMIMDPSDPRPRGFHHWPQDGMKGIGNIGFIHDDLRNASSTVCKSEAQDETSSKAV